MCFKPGADFEADNERGYNTYAFARAIGRSPPHAYQVWRQDFDKMLYDHARECGADAREGHEVIKVEQDGPRETRLEVNADDGRSYCIQARYVVDASGRDAFLSAKKKLRRKNDLHQSAAIFGHFRGAGRRPGADEGNISIYSFEHGWMWMIPLPDGVMSVGAVCRPDYLKQRKGRTVEFPARDTEAQPRTLAAHRAREPDRRRSARHRQLFLRLGPDGRRRLGADRRCLCVSRSGVLLRRVPGHERRGSRRRMWWTALCANRPVRRGCCADWRSASAQAWPVSPSSSTASTAR